MKTDVQVQQMLTAIETRLESMLARPRMWATQSETFEMQALAFLDARQIIIQSGDDAVSVDAFRHKYHTFVCKALGEIEYNGYLCNKISDIQELSKIMKPFVDEILKDDRGFVQHHNYESKS